MQSVVTRLSKGASLPKQIGTQKRTSMSVTTIGGRASVSGIIVTIFGATGFTGRYVINSFGKVGSQVVVPYRGSDNVYTHLRVMGDVGQIVPMTWNINDKDSIRRAAQYSNVIVNVVGRKWGTRNYSMQDVHVDGARRIAEVAQEFGVDRLIHVSALGASTNSETEWLRTKAAGEAAVKSVFPKATILRTGPLWGSQDDLLNNYAQVMRFWPMFPLMHPDRKMQPTYIGDLADAIVNAVRFRSAKGSTYELAGPKTVTERELANWVNTALKTQQKIVPVDAETAWHLGYWLGQHRKPRYNEDSVQETSDRVLSGKHYGFAELGIEQPLSIFSPQALEQILWYRRPARQMDISLDTEEQFLELNKITAPAPF